MQHDSWEAWAAQHKDALCSWIKNSVGLLPQSVFMILLKKKKLLWLHSESFFLIYTKGRPRIHLWAFFLLLLGSYQGIQLLLTALPTAFPHQHRLTTLLFLQCWCSDMNVLIGVIICTLCQEPPPPGTYRNLKKKIVLTLLESHQQPPPLSCLTYNYCSTRLFLYTLHLWRGRC